jgi:plastocyanin
MAVVCAVSWVFAASTRASDFGFQVTDEKGQPVEDAVISLSPLDATATPAPAAATAEIEQRGAQFHPLVTAVQRSTTVTFPNREKKLKHHVYSLSAPKRFEFPLYDPGETESLVFDRAGVVAIGCNIHDWMLAYVVVLDTPWFTKSDAAGGGRVAAVPPGRYRADVWHWRLPAVVSQEITISAGATATTNFKLTLQPDRRIRRTPPMGWRGYE